MFIRNYLISRDLSIKKTISTNAYHFKTLYDYTKEIGGFNAFKQYFPNAGFLCASTLPMKILTAFELDSVKQIVNIPRDEDAVLFLPFRDTFQEYVIMRLHSEKPELEVTYVEFQDHRQQVVKTSYFNQDADIKDIAKYICNECRTLWYDTDIIPKTVNM